MKAPRVQVADLQYLSPKAIRREVRRSQAWVSAHVDLMPGVDYTPTGQRRVPRVCVHEFIRQHRATECPACKQTAEAVEASAASAR